GSSPTSHGVGARFTQYLARFGGPGVSLRVLASLIRVSLRPRKRAKGNLREIRTACRQTGRQTQARRGGQARSDVNRTGPFLFAHAVFGFLTRRLSRKRRAARVSLPCERRRALQD